MLALRSPRRAGRSTVTPGTHDLPHVRFDIGARYARRQGDIDAVKEACTGKGQLRGIEVHDGNAAAKGLRCAVVLQHVFD